MRGPKSRGNWNMGLKECFPDCECFTCKRIKKEKEERKRDAKRNSKSG
jgi:hypothetical protein